MNQLPQIYCDMDQVLVNFMGGANKALKSMGMKSFPEEEKDAKWEALCQVPKFWENLDPMPGGLQLWRYIRQYDPIILSTPSKRMDTCKPEKIEWIKKNLGNVQKILLVPRDQKQNYAMTDNRPNLLIDDYEKNIKEWEAKGGMGVRHINTLSTISQLKKLGY